MTEPQIAVGILSGKEIQFSFPDEFISSDGMAISGIQQAVYRKGKIYWQEKEYARKFYRILRQKQRGIHKKDNGMC